MRLLERLLIERRENRRGSGTVTPDIGAREPDLRSGGGWDGRRGRAAGGRSGAGRDAAEETDIMGVDTVEGVGEGIGEGDGE